MQQLYLSRRNLEILLSKLDRARAGEDTSCTVIKYVVPTDALVNTCDVMVTAVENDLLYGTRLPGVMHPADENKIAPTRCINRIWLAILSMFKEKS